MDSNNSNKNIKCNVESCKHHNCNDYCSLQDIQVGANSTHAKSKLETECMSFECGCN